MPNVPQLDQGKIFVGGLSWQTTEESLRWHFEQYGPVASVEVMRNRQTGEPRGFAFVVFEAAATVDAVMEAGNHEVNHKIVDVKRAQARGVAPPSIHENRLQQQHQQQQHQSSSQNQQPTNESGKVFIGGIPHHVDKEELSVIMEQFGTVIDSIIMQDTATGRSRGFGFITFSTSEAAQKAIDNQPINIHGKLAEVKLATPRADQPKRSTKPLGLRAGQISSSNVPPEYAGLAVAFGRNGWKAGYGSRAFGPAGWGVWDQGRPAPNHFGFSFEMLKDKSRDPPRKRRRHEK